MAAQRGFPAPKTIQVDRGGTLPTIEVKVGQAQLGTYDVIIWPLRGSPRRVGRGDTLDNVSDVHRIVRTKQQLTQINRFAVTVVIAIQAVERRAGARWSYEIIVRQDDTVLDRQSNDGEVTQPLKTVRRAYKIELV